LAQNFKDLATTNPSAVAGFDASKLEVIKSNTAALQSFPPAIKTTALDAFVSSFHVVFITAAPITALGFLLALFLRETPLRTNKDYAAAREESAGESLG
jgi:ABC-type spermidine/putrescine transport system permease subunit II